MTKNPPEPKMTPQERRDRPQRDTLLGGHVLTTLGTPPDLLKIDVRRLWGDYFRVNVLTGRDITSARVAHSYFVRADGDGNIVLAAPAITKQF